MAFGSRHHCKGFTVMWAERVTLAMSSSASSVRSSGRSNASVTRHLGRTQRVNSRHLVTRNKTSAGFPRCSLKQGASLQELGARTRISSVVGLSQASVRGVNRSAELFVVYADEGKTSDYWALRDIGEGETKALGIEIRTNSVKAALIETTDGRFVSLV